MSGLPPPRATSLFRVIEKNAPGFAPALVFDVGANVGRSVADFLGAFPRADVHAFEPVSTTYEKLLANVAGDPRVHAHRLALGRQTCQVHMTHKPQSPTNRVLVAPTRAQLRKCEQVAMMPGDDFCRQERKEHVGMLKIDTEGHDLDVLIGFRNMLSQLRIDLVEAEVGMNRENTFHVPFEAVRQFLEPLGYRLFHIYEQAMETRYTGRPFLRRSNVVFASDAFVQANRRPR
jgi:FkbM family methyltransferase